MPYLSIIPAAAVADGRLSDTHIRVLCAIGTHTNKLGGNVWASVGTLAKESNLSERTVQRSVLALVECGYITRTERVGRTNLYEVSLQSLPPVTAVTPPPSAVSPPPDTGVTPSGARSSTISYRFVRPVRVSMRR